MHSPSPHHRLRRNYGGDTSSTESLQNLLAEQQSEIGQLDERQTHLELFLEDQDQRALDLVERVERLESAPSVEVPIRRLPALEPEPDTRLGKLLSITRQFVVAVVGTPLFGGAVALSLVGLVQVSSLYTISASILFICSMLIGYRKLVSVPF